MDEKIRTDRVLELSARIRKSLKALKEWDFLTNEEQGTIAGIFIDAWERDIANRNLNINLN